MFPGLIRYNLVMVLHTLTVNSGSRFLSMKQCEASPLPVLSEHAPPTNLVIACCLTVTRKMWLTAPNRSVVTGVLRLWTKLQIEATGYSMLVSCIACYLPQQRSCTSETKDVGNGRKELPEVTNESLYKSCVQPVIDAATGPVKISRCGRRAWFPETWEKHVSNGVIFSDFLGRLPFFVGSSLKVILVVRI